MAHAARALGLGVMLGCMVESGLGIAAGCVVAPLCDHVDLDGNLLLAEDPWPRRGSRRHSGPLRTSRGSVSSEQAERLLILRRDSPPIRTTARPRRGVLAYGRAAGRRDPRLDAGGGDAARRPDRRAVDDALSFAPTTARRRRRHPGRPLPAGLARAPEALHREGAARRERAARVPRRRRGARAAGGAARRRAARPAPPARRPRRADRREPRAAGAGSCSRSARTARSGR